MPDEATTRDVAKKLERWAGSLPEEDRVTVQGWMLLGTGRHELRPGQRWWFEASAGAEQPAAPEGL